MFTHHFNEYLICKWFTIHQHTVAIEDGKVKGLRLHRGGIIHGWDGRNKKIHPRNLVSSVNLDLTHQIRKLPYGTAKRTCELIAVLLYQGKTYSVWSWLSGKPVIS